MEAPLLSGRCDCSETEAWGRVYSRGRSAARCPSPVPPTPGQGGLRCPSLSTSKRHVSITHPLWNFLLQTQQTASAAVGAGWGPAPPQTAQPAPAWSPQSPLLHLLPLLLSFLFVPGFLCQDLCSLITASLNGAPAPISCMASSLLPGGCDVLRPQSCVRHSRLGLCWCPSLASQAPCGPSSPVYPTLSELLTGQLPKPGHSHLPGTAQQMGGGRCLQLPQPTSNPRTGARSRGLNHAAQATVT